MAKTYRTCPACNTNDITYTARNNREAERLADWGIKRGDVCRECLDKQRAAEAEKAAKENAALGLPALLGTPKQVAWAETIRAKTVGYLETVRLVAAAAEAGDEEAVKALVRELPHHYSIVKVSLRDRSQLPMLVAVCDVVQEQESASWWIDAGSLPLDRLARDLREQVIARLAGPEETAEEKPEAAAIRPENPVTLETVEVGIEPGRVTARLPERNDAFRAVVKGLGYRWDADRRLWYLPLYATNGRAEDRAAEVLHRLLGAGFIVSCVSAEAREKALNAAYEPIYPRWLSLMPEGSKFPGWIRVDQDDDRDIERELSRMKGRVDYSDSSVWYVRPSYYAQLRDMAQVHGFRITPGAEEALTRAQQEDEARLLAKDLPPAPEPQVEEGSLTLPTADGIAPDLRDND